jgi:eukaryotic-like serine/threonine-protein kinase
MSAHRLQTSRQPGTPLELPNTGDIVHGRYRVRHELGRGGMAAVLAAYDAVLERDIALKIMLPQLVTSREAVERFINEARSLAKLESPHVVRVLDCGRLKAPLACAGLPFMVLELLRGDDLYTVAAREGGLSAERVIRYALQACAGLAAAHAQGIVHRDLKPENLFLALDADGRECLKVLDFGIARSHSRRTLTRGRVGLGSPGYMSPEQVQGGSAIDARSDVWGVGVVMYELLAHRPAFVGDDPHTLCAQTLTGEVVPLGELCPQLPVALVQLVERCLERDPARRFSGVEELAQALRQAQFALAPSAPASIAQDTAWGAPIVEGIPVVVEEFTPVELDSGDVVELEPRVETTRTRPRYARRAMSWLLAAAILVPSIALLPRVAQAPELAPARAWSARVVDRAQHTWQSARARAHELWMKEPAGHRAPVEP